MYICKVFWFMGISNSTKAYSSQYSTSFNITHSDKVALYDWVVGNNIKLTEPR